MTPPFVNTRSFYYVISGTATQYQVAANLLSTSFSDVLLPQGGGNRSEILGIAYVADQLDAAAASYDIVQNLPAQMSVTELENITSTKMNSAFESGDVESVFQVGSRRAPRGARGR